MASIRKPYTGPEPECDATAATMARKPRHATRGQLEHRTRHVIAALERAQAAKQAPKAAPKADGKCWKCTARHEREHEADVCRRVHSNVTPWWSRAPGYVREEIEAERSKPASLPENSANLGDWADTWRQTWKLAQRANARVTFGTRADFLDAVAVHHKLLWEVGYGAA